MTDGDSDSGNVLLRKLRVDQVARWLEIHPFEVIRTLVRANALPDDLRLDAQDVERVRECGGLETWWDGAGAPGSDAELVAALIERLLERLPDAATSTRSDNIFRGLESHRQIFLRRVVNQLVRIGYLDIVMTAAGLSVTVRPLTRDALGAMTAGSAQVQGLVAQCTADGGQPG